MSAVPRRQTIRRIAEEVGIGNPASISGYALKEHLKSLPKQNCAGVDPDALLARLDAELDGACPLF